MSTLLECLRTGSPLPCVSDHRSGDEFNPQSPSFEPDAEYDERMEAITAARAALDDAEIALDKGQFGVCDINMAEAMNCLVPA